MLLGNVEKNGLPKIDARACSAQGKLDNITVSIFSFITDANQALGQKNFSPVQDSLLDDGCIIMY